MHKNLTLLGLGAVGGFMAGRFPDETRAALTKTAQRLESRVTRARHGRNRLDEALDGVVEPEPFPMSDPLAG